MSTLAEYWVGEANLGSAERKAIDVHGEYQPPSSLAFFCPKCGEVWGRIEVKADARLIPYAVYTITCARHPSAWATQVNGSLWLIWDKEHNAALPQKVIEREFELCLQHIERFPDNFEFGEIYEEHQ